MIKSIVLVVVSLVVSAGLGELGLRVLGIRGEASWTLHNAVVVDDEVVNFRFRPHTETFSGSVRYLINSRGFRDLERHHGKPKDTYRILVLGDSVAFGYKVKFDDVFSMRLQQALAGSGPHGNFEVMTLAMPGLNTAQEAHLLETEGKPYDPDLIIVAFSLNDADHGIAYRERPSSCRIELLHIPLPCGLKAILKRSALVVFVKERLDSLVWRFGVGDDDDVFRSLGSDYFVRLYEDSKRYSEHVLAGFDSISRVVREREVPVLLVIFPILHELGDYKWRWVHEKVAEDAESRGFRVLDLLDEYEAYPVNVLRIERGDFVHPSSLGHHIAANAVGRLLCAHDLFYGVEPSWSEDPRRVLELRSEVASPPCVPQ